MIILFWTSERKIVCATLLLYSCTLDAISGVVINILLSLLGCLDGYG